MNVGEERIRVPRQGLRNNNGAAFLGVRRETCLSWRTGEILLGNLLLGVKSPVTSCCPVLNLLHPSSPSQDMKKLEKEKRLDHVRLVMKFNDDYPFSPPFVRIVYPRFKRSTGYIIDGAFCMELLTNQARILFCFSFAPTFVSREKDVRRFEFARSRPDRSTRKRFEAQFIAPPRFFFF